MELTPREGSPVEHQACDDLRSHHGERRAGGIRVSNSCPRCGWFSEHISDWPKWVPSLPIAPVLLLLLLVVGLWIIRRRAPD